MFGNYFYNKNIRNVVILFGTVFNDIIVRRVNSSNVTQEEFRVPIAYGPSEKFLVRLREATDISKGKVGLTLPRMSFEFTAINYDPTRKLQTTKRYKKVHASDSTKLTTIYTPTPYDFDFTLSVMVKNSDDGTQILEQILPYFSPAYQVTMNEMSTMGIKRDIPIIFTGLSTEDSYEGDYLTRRALIHTLTFTVKAFLYGPISDVGLIKEVDVNTFNNSVGLVAPLIVFSGGGGSGAVAIATITDGKLTAVAITAGGSGYTSAPTIAFSGGGGSGAAATSTVSGGQVRSIAITAAGTGYDTPKKVRNTDVKPDPLSADADDAYGYTTTHTDSF